MEEEVTKAKFKELFFHYSTPNSGWTPAYWNQFYESLEGGKFFFTKPATPESTRMFIVSEGIKHRIIFMTEEAEESFFSFPSNDDRD